MRQKVSRRRFLGVLPGVAAAALVRADRLLSHEVAPSGGHPEPRPGIDGSSVLDAGQLADAPHVIEIYDGVREIPGIIDGIRCYCGCAELPTTRSLLSCYEEGGMARFCAICQGEARLAYRRRKEGQSLEQIRRAVDARFGPGAGAGDVGHPRHRPEGVRPRRS